MIRAVERGHGSSASGGARASPVDTGHRRHFAVFRLVVYPRLPYGGSLGRERPHQPRPVNGYAPCRQATGRNFPNYWQLDQSVPNWPIRGPDRLVRLALGVRAALALPWLPRETLSARRLPDGGWSWRRWNADWPQPSARRLWSRDRRSVPIPTSWPPAAPGQ